MFVYSRIKKNSIQNESFIDKCFKKFLRNIHLVKENVLTVKKKCLLLVLPYLGVITLQARTKLQQVFKGALNFCKLEISF